MPEVILILIRAILSFTVLLILTRIMGKRQISQLTFFDYVVGISIGSIAASVSIDPGIKIIHGLAALFAWCLFPFVLSLIDLKSYRFRNITEGSPTVLIEKGKVLEKNLKKEKITIEDMMILLRQRNAFKLSDVEFAIMENNGKISVMKKSDVQPITPKKLNKVVENESAPRMVILNGHVMETTLREMGYTKEWLLGEIQKQGASDYNDVFIAQLEDNGKLYVDLLADQKKVAQPHQKQLLAATMQKTKAELQKFALETQNPSAKQLYNEQAKKMEQILDVVKPYLK